MSSSTEIQLDMNIDKDNLVDLKNSIQLSMRHCEYSDLEEYIYEIQNSNCDLNTKMSNNHSTTNLSSSSSSLSINGTSRLSSSLSMPSEKNVQNNQSLIESIDLNEENFRKILSEKEKDLILAAELGKALLERNEDLTRANEKITEEYSHKLELLEQEKHGLRRQLNNLESEYEARIAEMQSDLNQLKKDLTEKQNLLKQTEKEKANLVQELVEQNQRLTEELKQRSDSEDQLSDQLQSLRDQIFARRNNYNDQVAQLDGLKEEINILSKRKNDLERRITILKDDRERLSLSLDESSDRILLLERDSQERENYIRSLELDIEESRQLNSQLQFKLDTLQKKYSNDRTSQLTSIGNTSLYNEIEMSSTSIEVDLLSDNGQLNSTMDDIDIDGVCEDDQCFCLKTNKNNFKVYQELIEVYQGLRRLYQDLQRTKDTSGQGSVSNDSGVPSTPEEIQRHHLRVGMVTSIIKEIQLFINEIINDYNHEQPCTSCKQLLDERQELQKLRKEITELKEDLSKEKLESNQIATRITILEAELKAAKEERDNLKESLNTDCNKLGKDEIVKRAWELRDAAVSRKNTVEIELAKTRIECMHINSQLMEAIQQKIELSQQLEQWQVDMQSLLDEQLKKKLSNIEQEERRKIRERNALKGDNDNTSNNSNNALNNCNKILRLWKR